MTYGNIVEEEQRLGTLCQYIIHAHCHSVDTDSVVLVHLERQLQLGTYTIGTAHKDRLLVAERCQVEHTAESSDVTHHARARGRFYVRLDAAHYFVSGFEVYTGIFITFSHISILYNLLFAEIVYGIGKDALLLVAVNVLKEVLLVTLRVTHLTQDLTTCADNTLDAIA